MPKTKKHLPKVAGTEGAKIAKKAAKQRLKKACEEFMDNNGYEIEKIGENFEREFGHAVYDAVARYNPAVIPNMTLDDIMADKHFLTGLFNVICDEFPYLEIKKANENSELNKLDEIRNLYDLDVSISVRKVKSLLDQLDMDELVALKDELKGLIEAKSIRV